MKLDVDDIVNFVSRLLHKVLVSEISIDKAFQYVKSSWRDRESFKIYYDISFNVVKNYFKLRYLSRRIFGTETCKDIVRTWLVLHGLEYFHKKNIIESYVRKLLRRRGLKGIEMREIAERLIEELKDRDILEYLSVKYSYPRTVIEILAQMLPIEEIEKLLESLNNPTTWIRVNTLKIDIDKCIKMLEKDNIIVEEDKDIPFLLRVIEARRPIHHADTIRNMLAIPQDKASILTVMELEPEKGDIIYDLCAAPGMKSSLIMQLTENKANLTLVDISKDRVSNMMKILKKTGVDLSKINIVLSDSRNIKLRIRHNCKILIDAPCSSSGAAGKDPAVRIALRELKRLPWYVNIQRSILKNIINQVREAKIIYVTCSLLPQEGEENIENLLENADIRLERPSVRFVEGYSRFKIGKMVGRTFPHVHDSEGFFIAKILT
ncbi:MAG: RsmB/NOP family class I SAM-dependent RNA methyltransferase [Crenarchaeota archaeon]|nr:RsmB/NOP family class I SAM-dependent RNA methyltransferase [Thermoproteota archaeon]